MLQSKTLIISWFFPSSIQKSLENSADFLFGNHQYAKFWGWHAKIHHLYSTLLSNSRRLENKVKKKNTAFHSQTADDKRLKSGRAGPSDFPTVSSLRSFHLCLPVVGCLLMKRSRCGKCWLFSPHILHWPTQHCRMLSLRWRKLSSFTSAICWMHYTPCVCDINANS